MNKLDINLMHIGEADVTEVVETRLMTLTELATFRQTVYSQFASLKSTIDVATIITVSHGTSPGLLTYTYKVGPSGVGWGIPSPSNGAPLPPQPSELPGTLIIPSVSGDSNTTLSRNSASGLRGPSATTTASTKSSTENSTRDPTPRLTGATSNGASTQAISATNAASDTITGTITSFPTGFTAVELPDTSYTANEWITTTDSKHHTTLLPVIVIGGGHGITFWNLPLIPHVVFSLPKFPNLPKLPDFHLPCIKVFGIRVSGDCTDPPESDGPPPGDSGPDPTTDDPGSRTTDSDPNTTGSDSKTTRSDSKATNSKTSSSKTTSSQCSVTHTVSNCMVQCVSIASSSSCASYSTTCSQTSTGCSVQGTTSTASSSGCLFTPAESFMQVTQTFCNGNCLTPQSVGNAVPPTATGSLATTGGVTRRDIAGRITVHPLQKRGSSSPISTLGGCALQTPAASPLTRPAWPAPSKEVFQPELAGNLEQRFSAIPRYDRATQINCVFTTARLSAEDFSKAPNWQDMIQKSYGNSNNAVSMDHACKIAFFLNVFHCDTNINSQTKNHGSRNFSIASSALLKLQINFRVLKQTSISFRQQEVANITSYKTYGMHSPATPTLTLL
jgi:hypothetical protein